VYDPVWPNEGISSAAFCRQGRVTENRSPARDFRAVPEPECPDLTGLRILIVEDSVELGIAVASLLCSCGAEVAGPVATAADADRLIAAGLPEAAVIDLHLRAGERADELIVRLNARGVRVVVTSGDSSRLETRVQAAATLSKPFSEEELIAALMPAQVALIASRTAQTSVAPLPTAAIR
jgi:CheY-like chemotaxis protein